MPQQVHEIPARQHRRTVTREEANRLAEEAAAAQARSEGHVTVADINDVLEEIDSVLEENAVEVVRAYIQKNGQ